ncbi:Pimeloyl-ACP methyl ester carboxylesterase [Natronoarchaeum philippinense]|uniref:Pimeloyl-ACP methyl ester carboxylesterase n=1 Tax=Natronoarchaeum philippinense TaxID=558529 RepID=A0A285P6C4_NATPI|nr:alpha/beta hydrolase [Natronoarchaeum philippinense]SNZ15696.1 Pimeloyl-ACP methyl ester carboxylesterase [Natronoarchaeum philippinense]
MQTTTTDDGTSIEYERRGDGRPLILLHGGMAPRQYWEPVVPHFEEYAAVIPQRPGFGTCLDDPAETSAADIVDREAEYVRALVDAVEGQPILLGHSFGALTAFEAATDAPIEAVVGYEPAVLPEDYRGQADLADRMQALLDEGDRREAIKRYVEQVLHPDGIDDLDAWLAEWPVWPECVDLAEEVVRMNRAVERYRLPDRLDVEASALVLTGTDGPAFLRESARAVHEALPHSRFVEFDGVSHSGPAEAPATVAAAVESFLATRR